MLTSFMQAKGQDTLVTLRDKYRILQHPTKAKLDWPCCQPLLGLFYYTLSLLKSKHLQVLRDTAGPRQ